MKKPTSIIGKKLIRLLIVTIWLFSYAQFTNAQSERLKKVLDNFKQKKVFISMDDPEGLKKSISLLSDEILVIYGYSNPSSGYQWSVEGYDNKVVKIENIPLHEMFESCPAPGAWVYQSIVVTGQEKGNSDLKLVYHRPWEKQRSKAAERTISVQTEGSFKSTFTFDFPKATYKSLAPKDYQLKALPSYFDWRDQNVVTPVKDQGTCGSCWAFGTTAGFEAKIKKKDGVERDLSEQYLVSCNEWGMSCAGGWWAHDLWWNAIPAGEKGAGAVYEQDFPYESMDVPCNAPHEHYEQLEGWAYTDDIPDNRWPTMDHTPTVAQIKEKLYQWGPIPTALSTENWGTYTGGVLSGSTATTQDHIVMITGWDDANQCWIVKNSWGSGWGEGGYIRIGYNSHLCGNNSTYLMYDKTNPRLVYQGEQFYEAIENDGAIRRPIELKFLDGNGFSLSTGQFTQGTHYSVSNLPSGLSIKIEVISNTRAKVTLLGKATNHLNVNDVNNLTISFTNAAFNGLTASEVESSTYSLTIDFFDPYQIVYQDIADLTITSSDPWKPFTLPDGNAAYGLWYSYYDYYDQVGSATFFLESYTKRMLCTTQGIDVTDRMIKVLNNGDIIDPYVSFWEVGGSYGDQHRITNNLYTAWNGRTAYAGFTFNLHGGQVYGWFRLQVASGGQQVTLLDYAYNQEPYAPILAGQTSNTTLQPIADFEADMTDIFAGETVQFTDLSGRKPTSWSWSFPGGSPSSSSLKHPQVTYNSPGTYNVSLTCSNSAGSNTKTKSGYITVYPNNPPSVAFTTSSTTVPVGAQVEFTEQCTNLPTSWSWSFPGGNPSSSLERNPIVTYNNTGSYNVSLTSTNKIGSNSLTKSSYIQVTSVPQGYCTATSSYSSPGSFYIANVQLANMSCSSDYGNGYQDHTDHYASLEKGQSYTVTVQTNADHWPLNSLGVWIDWNQNGAFTDNGETILSMNGTSQYSATFTVPSSAIGGMTRMRVRCHYQKTPFACGDENYLGEAEDFTIVIPGSIDNQAPTAPTNLTASNVTSSSVNLNWNASTDNVGVTGYDVYRGSTNIGSTTNTSYNVTGLSANTSYTFSVRARDAAGNVSASSNTVNVTTQSGGSCISSFPYTESFESGLGDFTQGTGDDTDWTRQSGSTPSSSTGPTSADDGSYYMFIESSSPYYPNYVANLVSACFNFSSLSNPTLNFSYHMYGANMGTLNVQASTNGGASWTTIWSLSGDQGNSWQSANISLASYAGQSSVTIRFNGITGSSYRSDMAIDMISIQGGSSDTQAPTAPTNLTASNITSGSVDLNWNASTDNVGVTGYDVYRGSTNIGSATNTSYTVTGLSANTSYTFSVRAKDAAGNVSLSSNTANVTTQSGSDTQAPTAPTNLTASNVTSSSVSLNWNASTDNVGVTGYDVYRGSTNIGSATNTSYNATGLSANTSYIFSVRARDAEGNVSASSNTVNVTTTGGTVTYCSSQSTDQTYEWIAGVQIGSFNNTSGASPYTDFTSMVINLSTGSNVPVTLTPGFRPNEPYNEAWAVWIDYNKNGSFDDSGERVFTNSGSTSAVSGSFTVPSSASGTTRMRVSMKYNGIPTSCESFNYGEVEDYTVSFAQAGPTSSVQRTTIENIVVKPNPNNGNFTVVIPGGMNGTMTANVFDMNGQLVFQKTIELTGEPMEVPVSTNVPAGIYMIKIMSGDQVFTKQIVVQ